MAAIICSVLYSLSMPVNASAVSTASSATSFCTSATTSSTSPVGLLMMK